MCICAVHEYIQYYILFPSKSAISKHIHTHIHIPLVSVPSYDMVPAVSPSVRRLNHILVSLYGDNLIWGARSWVPNIWGILLIIAFGDTLI